MLIVHSGSLEMFASSVGSFHSDVLSANPESDDQKRHLVEEIKSRCKGCISSRNFPEAVKLYSKAIEVIPTVDAEASSILHANRSMCYLSMGNSDLALSDADRAISLDSNYTKAYFRKSSALLLQKRYSEARDALAIGLSQKPNDKDLLSQMAKVNEALTNQPVAATSSSSPTVTTTTTTSSNSSTSIKKSPINPVSQDKSDPVLEEEDVSLGGMKGYKKTADGRTTTFFNRELDENAKQIIGDIAPKKIDNKESVESSNVIGSSWNAAGTFESRDLTPWAKERLCAVLTGVVVEQDGKRVKVVCSVGNITGDAEIVAMRGKRKHVCDFTVNAKFTVENSDDSAELVTGDLLLHDITADGDYEINCSNGGTHLVAALKKSFEKILGESILEFIAELKSKV